MPLYFLGLRDYSYTDTWHSMPSLSEGLWFSDCYSHWHFVKQPTWAEIKSQANVK